MKLQKIVLHGTQCNRQTGWQTWPAFVMLHFDDGPSKFMGDISFNEALSKAKAFADTADFEKQIAESAAKLAYPPKPEAELYQHGWGYEKPVSLGNWEWSITFGRWSRIVTFDDGWHGFTYPKTF